MFKNRPLLAVAAVALAIAGCDKKPALPADGRREIRIAVEDHGYSPVEARAPAGKPVRLVFTRTTDEGCGQQLAIPSLKIQKDLPLNEPVAIDVTMPASGSLAFTCGMAMYKGAIVVQ